jgi:hypothetical protein
MHNHHRTALEIFPPPFSPLPSALSHELGFVVSCRMSEQQFSPNHASFAADYHESLLRNTMQHRPQSGSEAGSEDEAQYI